MAKQPNDQTSLRRAQFRRLRDRLYQFDRRNKALYFNKPAVTRFVRLSGWAGAAERSAVSWVTGLLDHAGGAAVPITPLLPADEDDRATFERRLEGLRREDLRLRRDLGLPALFLATPILEWVDPTGRLGTDMLRSPLLLIPVQLETSRRRGMPFTVRLAESELPVNPSLRQYLRRNLGDELSLPEGFVAEDPWQGTVEALRAALAGDACDVSIESEAAAMDDPAPNGLPTGPQVELPLASPPPPAGVPPAALAVSDRRWAIRPEVWLGIFRYPNAKLVADYDDLEQRDEDHPVVDRLLGVPVPARPLPDIDPDKLPERENFYVMPVDGSQQRAIAAVSRGHDVVVHGPPGTGKSQTIVNIVADCVAKGRTVLFVSEKRAALDVVYARLQAVGLTPFSMYLHRSDERKRMVAEELGHALGGVRQGAAERDNWDMVVGALEGARDELVRLHEFLASDHPSGPCRRDIDWRLHKLRRCGTKDLPALDPSIAMLSEPEVARRVGRLRAFAERRRAMTDDQRYLESVLSRNALRQPEATAAALRTVLRDVEAERSELRRLADELAQRTDPRLTRTDPNTLAALAAAKIEAQPADYDEVPLSIRGQVDRLSASAQALEAVAERVQSAMETQARLATQPAPSIAPEQARQLAAALRGWVGRWTRGFRRNYRELRAYAKTVLPPGWSFSLGGTVGFLDAFVAAHDQARAETNAVLEQGVRASMAATDGETLGPYLDRVRRVLALTRRLAAVWTVAQQFVRPEDLAPFRQPYSHGELEDHLRWFRSHAQAMAASFDRLRDLAERPKGLFHGAKDHIWFHGKVMADVDSEEDRNKLVRLGEALAELPRLQVIEDARRELEEDGLRAVVEQIVADANPDPGSWADALWAAVLQAWSRQLCQEHPQRGAVDHRTIATARRDITELTARQVDRARHAVVSRLVDRVRRASAAPGKRGEANPFEQGLSLLEREATKKGKWRPAAELVRMAREPLLALKPVWLMSPLRVAEVMPLQRDLFDVVIFDEASQVPPENAVPAIWRARQLVVCGDHKQLPPTDFFRATPDDEEEEAAAVAAGAVAGLPDLAGSLLHAARGAFPEVRLDWHYRSHSEELIQFSNYRYYDGRLVTVPAFDSGVEPPIEFHRVDGAVYGRGGSRANQREAEFVADLVLRHLSCTPPDEQGPTMGIIALSVQQQAAIEGALRSRAEKRGLGDRLEAEFSRSFDGQFVGLFVKNLETVQGDERDIVILSVGYGPGPDGRMSRNFGPINTEGGENRLNVAISRAKRKMIVVCSFDPEGLVAGDRAEGGLASLAQYLRYAAAVGARRDFRPLLASVTPGREPGPPRRSRPEDTSWEEEVASILGERGLVVKREVGSGPFRLDFGLALPAAPDRLVCGIECDGPSYHVPATVRDRDVVRIQQLESRGWRLHALWSPDWIRDPLGEVERVLAVVAKET
ncbi:MAG: DUF4011 domain-containing protein [Acidobacteria bacterium]|nr:DUF4011 domain-containing protein [Acidobacteriota bacterium]